MAGKFNWSLNDPSATARQMRDTQRHQREDLSGMSNAMTKGLAYLSGGAGYAQSKTIWEIKGRVNTPNSQTVVLPFDPQYDMDLIVPVPASGRFVITLSAWISLAVNAYVDGQQPISIAARMGMMPYTYDGTEDDPGLPQGIFGGGNAYLRFWSANGTNEMGFNTSAQQFAWRRDSDTLHVRTRRFYLATTENADGSVTAMPNGSWYSGLMQSAVLQVIPMYTGTVLPS